MNFNPKFPNLFKPYQIGNVVLKSRMLASASKPAYIQGPENYPSEAIITHYANKAKNGAAAVTVSLVLPTAKYAPAAAFYGKTTAAIVKTPAFGV